MQLTIISGGDQGEWCVKGKILLFGSQKVYVLLYEMRSDEERKKKNEVPTLIKHGSVTTAFSSTVSTKGSRSAISLMQE